jgi:nicotinate-nucleotide pyrophosphorylase (carboxylating)
MVSGLLEETIRLALLEDIGHGDITSSLIVPESRDGRAVIRAKEDLVLAGMPFVRNVFFMIDSGIKVKPFFDEGAEVQKGSVIAEVAGNTRGLLAGERTALNILQRVSGIATLTRAYKKLVSDLPVKIVDTRKTLPGMRFMEKYGVRAGGGDNHRFGLYDGVLIKDNHIKVAGGVKTAVELAKQAQHLLKIEVEISSFEVLGEALEAGADVIMLDNMSVTDMIRAVEIAKGRALLEASGNINIDNVREIARTGVDLISVGALTHSAKAVDISMKIE